MNWGSFWLGALAMLGFEVVLVLAMELFARWRNRDHGVYMKDWEK